MERNEQALTPVEKDEIEIDFRELFHTLWQKFWVLLLALAIGAAFAAGLTLITTPKYQATSMIYVFNRETDLSTLASLQIGSQLTADFEILATSRPVVEKVIRQLGLEMSYDELVAQIKIGNPEDAHMLTITVTDSDPQQAANISNALSDALSDRVEEVIDTDRPNQVEEAVVPQHPSSPSMKKMWYWAVCLDWCWQQLRYWFVIFWMTPFKQKKMSASILDFTLWPVYTH